MRSNTPSAAGGGIATVVGVYRNVPGCNGNPELRKSPVDELGNHQSVSMSFLDVAFMEKIYILNHLDGKGCFNFNAQNLPPLTPIPKNAGIVATEPSPETIGIAAGATAIGPFAPLAPFSMLTGTTTVLLTSRSANQLGLG